MFVLKYSDSLIPTLPGKKGTSLLFHIITMYFHFTIIITTIKFNEIKIIQNDYRVIYANTLYCKIVKV